MPIRSGICISAVYACLVKLLTTFLLALVSLSANAESYYVSNNPATVSNVVEVIQGHKFIVDIAEPHPLAGSVTIFLAETYSPKVETPCVKESELGMQAKEYVAQQLATAKNVKLTHYRKTSKGAIAGVSLDGWDLAEDLIKKGFASEDYDYFTAYYCSAYKAMMRGWVVTNNNEEVARAVFWLERSLELGGSNSTRTRAFEELGWKNQDLGDNQKALEWLTKALELSPNNSNVTGGLGDLNRDMGNYEESFKWWKQAAELGNKWAQDSLGYAYLHGEGTTVDLDQAEYWLTKAVEQGVDSAQRHLAEVYIRKGDTDNAQKATEALTSKANNGDAYAMHELGSLYNNMNNYEEAFKWWKQSAELGNSGAQDDLGRLYMWGNGVPANLGLAEYWLTKAVDAGNEWAVNSLGELYVEAGSYPTALKWFNKALESSHARLRVGAMNGIGYLYKKEGDTSKSIIWWQQSAELGDSAAQVYLGNAYLNGDGISRDLELAKKWLTLAVQQGNEWAQNGLDELNEQ